MRSMTDEGEVFARSSADGLPAERAPSSERLRRPPSPTRGEGTDQTLPTVLSRALGWISFWLMTTVWPLNRSMMERT